MTDRAMQALEALALDPIIESTSDKHSYGFRKERSCHDARVKLFSDLSNRYAPQWIVEGDIKACFDEIAHDWLLEHTPMDKARLKEFLKAGYVYDKQLFPTERGTPQGGVLSPILANHTLNGMDALLADNFKPERTWKGKPYVPLKPKVNLVRYADDFVITARTREIAEKVKEQVRSHVRERGLQLSEEKTVITSIEEGFDFLGWNFRKYNGKLLIKPSKESQKRIREKIRAVILGNIGRTQDELIRILNPIIMGWSTYHQGAVSKRVFSRIDSLTFRLLWKWARRRHPNKGRRWIKNRYWKTVGKKHWTFKDTLTLKYMADRKIVRHIPLKSDMNPYIDKDYFQKRHRKLLINRNLGLSTQHPQTTTGKLPADACLHEA
jgi:RNA-directed DNA polymerase